MDDIRTCQSRLDDYGLPLEAFAYSEEVYGFCDNPVAADTHALDPTQEIIDSLDLTDSDRPLMHRYCPQCLRTLLRRQRAADRERELNRRKQVRRERCDQALRHRSDRQIIRAIEEHHGDLTEATYDLVPDDIPLLKGYHHSLSREIKRRELSPILEHARLQARISKLQDQLAEALTAKAELEQVTFEIKQQRL